jgi:hypothetical protein
MGTSRKGRGGSGEMKVEYDFSSGVRGKYVAAFAPRPMAVVLAADVAEVFRTAKAVNEALRSQIRKKPARRRRVSRRSVRR